MDDLSDVSENTSVIRMHRDFNAFLSGHEQHSLRLNLDKDIFSKPKPKSTSKLGEIDQSSRAIKEKLEREKQEKLREAELLAAQSKVVQLETQLAASATSSKRARIDFENDLESFKSEKDRELEQVSDLRSQIKQLKERERHARAELAEGRQEAERTRATLEAKLRGVGREKLALEELIQEVKEESWQDTLRYKEEADRCLTQKESAELELAEVNTQLDLTKREMQEIKEQLAEVDELKEKARASEDKIKVLQEELDKQAEDAAVTRALRTDVDKVPSLEKEVVRLRTETEYWSQEKENALLLREQLSSVERKLEAAERRSAGMARLEVEHEELKERLARWEVHDTSGSRRPQSPSSLCKQVAQLQAVEALNLQEKGQLQSQIYSLDLQVRELREQQRGREAELTNGQAANTQQTDLIKRLRRKLLLVQKERESFRGILDSYESEMTMPIAPDNRRRELEEAVEGWQQHCGELEAQLDSLSQQHTQATARCAQLDQECQSKQAGSFSSLKADQDKISELQERVIELEGELEKTIEEKQILEDKEEFRACQGEYDPAKTKVLHFTMNPSAVAQQKRQEEFERLKSENERLVARVNLLETSGGAVADLTLQVEKQVEALPDAKMVQDLKDQVAKGELRNKRLVDAFKQTSQEFRETCYQLLGYKIDLPCQGQYRLASMYSDSPKDFFLFKQGPGGEVQMLETEFSKQHEDLLETYLEANNSIPALLSAITLQLFNAQTMISS